ncbi:MAG: hypothetical protein JXO48_05680 [Deltaproteobacteria bacterium]|nr:hypothetical protein [Deltaproteobacteria bacterium]
MNEELVAQARMISENIARSLHVPRFYREKADDVERSLRSFETHPLVRAGEKIVLDRIGSYGHGISHARKVAVDAGAIILIEAPAISPPVNVERLLCLSHLSGLFHDIKRSEPSHAQAGAEETDRLLKDFDITGSERKAITAAIEKHEAFQPYSRPEEPAAQLLSGALYDADKFRWGPDNFTEMIWDIVTPLNIPMEKLLEHFLPGLKGIEKIRGTFRTATGKEYGPDFIDLGLSIGIRLYEELASQTFYSSPSPP